MNYPRQLVIVSGSGSGSGRRRRLVFSHGNGRDLYAAVVASMR